MTLSERARSLISHLAQTVGLNPDSLMNVSIGLSVFLVAVGFFGVREIGALFSGVLLLGVVTGMVSISGKMLVSQKSGRRKRLNEKPERITDAQVYAMIDRRSKLITPSRLARATHSTSEAALQKLRNMHADNQLEIDSNKSETELVFYRREF